MSDGNGALPSLPKGWSWAEFRDVASIDSRLVAPADFPNHPHIAPDNIGKGTGSLLDYRTIAEDGVTSNKNHFFPGQIVYSKIRPYLSKVIVADFEGLCSADMYPVSTPLELQYLFRYMLSDYFLAAVRNQAGNRVVLPKVNQKQLYDVQVPIAPEAEQRRIVSKIESLQERSSRARQALSEVGLLLAQFRQSVLRAAFSGRLTADWRAANPDVEPASELLSRIRTERRHRWEQSQLAKYKAKGKKPPKNWKEKYKEPEPVDEADLPSLPEGWCWASWEQVGFCQNGRAFPSKHYAESGVKLLRPGNLHVSGEVFWNESNSRFMPEEWHAEHPTYVVGASELVMNLTAQSLKDEFLGRVCLTGPDEHCLLNQRIARIMPVEPLSPEFCLMLFKSPVFRRYVDTLNTGSLIQHMFTTQVFGFTFPLPPLDEHKAIVEVVRAALRVNHGIEQSAAESESALTQLDQSILAKAFRGELVPQEPRDEPASELLARIRAARETTTKSKKKVRPKKNRREPAR